jgi:hypothetical protein
LMSAAPAASSSRSPAGRWWSPSRSLREEARPRAAPCRTWLPSPPRGGQPRDVGEPCHRRTVRRPPPSRDQDTHRTRDLQAAICPAPAWTLTGRPRLLHFANTAASAPLPLCSTRHARGEVWRPAWTSARLPRRRGTGGPLIELTASREAKRAASSLARVGAVIAGKAPAVASHMWTQETPEAGTCGRSRTAIGHGRPGLRQALGRRDLALKAANAKPRRPHSAQSSTCSPTPARPPRTAVSYPCLTTAEGHGSHGAKCWMPR